MLPSLGFGETLVILLLAIVVVGPEDLPVMMRKIGRFMGKIRGMANEFKQAFDEIGAESEIAELRKEIQALKELPPEEKEFMREMNALNTELRDSTDLTKTGLPKDASKEA